MRVSGPFRMREPGHNWGDRLNEVEARDRLLYRKHLFGADNWLRPGIAYVACSAVMGGLLLSAGIQFAWVLSAVTFAPALGFVLHHRAKLMAKRDAFIHPSLGHLWRTCEERLKSVQDGAESLRKSQIADLQEMPGTVERVASALYLALRRADIVLKEIGDSEGKMQPVPGRTALPSSHDAQTDQLFQIADRNLAEYRQQYSAVLAMVTRTEAQANVFITTLDGLRIKMLGHRLVGREPGMVNGDFLSAMGEARAQLDTIDKALDELDMNPFAALTSPPATEEEHLDT